MSDSDFNKKYEEYKNEAATIRAREQTATMTRPNTAITQDPKKWAMVSDEDVDLFWENMKCLTI